VFQLRLDGQPAGAGGEVFVANSSTLSVASQALFTAPAGAHTVEIWARTTTGGGAEYPCTIGPAGTGVTQTLVIEEIVT
jgi:hypothetical protein